MSIWTHDEPDEQIVEVGETIVILPPSRLVYVPHELDRDMQRACAKTRKSWRIATQTSDVTRSLIPWAGA